MRFNGGKIRAAAAILGCLLIGSLLWAAVRKLPRKISICELQGTGEVSPFQDREVVIHGVVIQTDLEVGEFALLDGSCPESGQGSRGVLVSLGGLAYPLQPGDEVQIQGMVREVDRETRLQANPQGLKILSLENPLPEPADPTVCLMETLCCSLEDWEGQLIRVSKGVSRDDPGLEGQVVAIPELDPDLFLRFMAILVEKAAPGFPRTAGSLGLESLENENPLGNLTGLLRQNQAGYYLQLVEVPKLSLTYPQQRVGDTPQVWQATGSAVEENTPSAVITATLTSSPTTTWTPSPTVIPSPTYYPIPLLITEIMPNPAGEEPGGEWFEIYNPGGKKLTLSGIKIGDEVSPGGKEGLVRFPDGYQIAAGGVLVIANQARVFEAEYGFRPDFELSDSDSRVPDLLAYPDWGRSAVQLSNAADEVLLVSPWDQVLDLVAYGAGGSAGTSQLIPAPREGHSLERYPPELDRNLPGDWRESSAPSPGRLNRTPSSQTPSPLPSATSPIACSPSPSSTESPELTVTSTGSPVNPTLNPTEDRSATPTLHPSPDPLQSQTCTLTVTQVPPGTATASLPTAPAPGISLTAFLTQTASQTPWISPSTESTRTVPVTAAWTGTPSPIVEETQTVIPTTCVVTPSLIASATAGNTIAPSPSVADTPWSTISLTNTPVVPDTPLVTGIWTTTPTGSGTPLPPLQINEIHADPDPYQGDSNRDGEVNADDDEFLELVNLSEDDLSLDGWEIYDNARLRYTFPTGTVLKAGCGLVVFGGGSPSGDFGGSLIFTAGSLGLNNDGDNLVVKDQLGEQITSCSYGEEGGQNQSLTRFPDLSGELPLVLHSLVIDAQGALFSPGWRTDGTAFENCP